jgi:hypothetical protein
MDTIDTGSNIYLLRHMEPLTLGQRIADEYFPTRKICKKSYFLLWERLISFQIIISYLYKKYTKINLLLIQN